jgi:hypothetical protein
MRHIPLPQPFLLHSQVLFVFFKFTKVLQYIQTNPPGVKMNERNNKLRLIVDNIESVEQAIEALAPLALEKKTKEKAEKSES